MQAIDLGPAALSEEADGTIRVGRTRVTLDTVVAAFDAGATPEEIVQGYPSLDLTSVYGVITYILSNRARVDAYVAGRDEARRAVREDAEARFPPDGLRARLLARKRTP